MDDNKEKQLVLVYYKVRGKMQPVRNLVCYLGLKVIQVHLQQKEQQKKKLPIQVLKCLKGIRIEKSLLPLLVHEGLYVYDIYPIMAYLCRRFNHEELLGRNIKQKAKLQQIIEIFFIRQPNSMLQMFKLSDFCAGKAQDIINKQKRIYFQKFMNQSNYLKQICQYLTKQQNPEAYIFQTITLIDFLFLESCHYMLGMFNTLDEKRVCPITHELLDIFSIQSPEKTSNLRYLSTIRAFLNNMYHQPFYINNKEYLQSMTIICSNFTYERVRGLRDIWVFNKKFVE